MHRSTSLSLRKKVRRCHRRVFVSSDDHRSSFKDARIAVRTGKFFVTINMAAHQHALALRKLFLSILLLISAENAQQDRRRRRKYQSPINANRHKSHYFNLIQELWLASASDRTYLRMTMGQFETLLNRIGPSISKGKNHRHPISPGERLALTLR